MTSIIDHLIAFLTELRGMSLVSQILTLTGIPSVIAFFFGIPVWFVTRNVREYVIANRALEARLKTAQRETVKLQAEVDVLYAETSEAFLVNLERNIQDGNDELAMACAEAYLDRQRSALLRAFRTRMDEAIRQSVDDGAAAYATARLWAQATLALAPDDQMLGMLIDELNEAEAIAASGVRVKLKGDMDRRGRAARMERLPSDLAALAAALWKERDSGHYTLMLFLAEHGLTLTRRRPFGEGSIQHLRFRSYRAAALLRCGQTREALIELEAILPLQIEVQGVRHSDVLMTRYYTAVCRRESGDAVGALTEFEALLEIKTEVDGVRDFDVLSIRAQTALCRKLTGDAVGALTELEALLPLQTEVLGQRHSYVLMTREIIASCRRAIGDLAGALTELQALLPLQSKVQGPRHPDVLTTRTLTAVCRQDTGDAAGALNELEALLPLQTEVQGPRHNYVLKTREIIASCRRDIGDAAGALTELEALLPLQTEVQGPRHPDVLSTRSLTASCRRDIGDAAGALTELEALLPLQREVQGAGHPEVLNTRILRATCLVSLGEPECAAAEIVGVQSGLSAAGLRAEHRYFRLLEEIEMRLGKH